MSLARSRALSPPAGKQKTTMQLVFTSRNVYLHIDAITSAHRRRILMSLYMCWWFLTNLHIIFLQKVVCNPAGLGVFLFHFFGPAWTVGDTAPCCFCWNRCKYACDDHRLQNKAQNNSTGGRWGGAEITVSLSNWNSTCFLMCCLVNRRLALAVLLMLPWWSLV